MASSSDRSAAGDATTPGSSGLQSHELPTAGRLAGLDYGTKRVGVALSTPEQNIASPYETYPRRGPQRDAEYFAALVREHRIVGFVVGLPIHVGGEEGVKAGEARAFGAAIREITGRPVAFWDERYTTSVAEDLMREAGVPRRQWKARLDKLAAQIVLQSYLDERLRQRTQAP